MWKKFEIYSIKKLLVRKGRAFYATLYQEMFFCNPAGVGVLNTCVFVTKKSGMTESDHLEPTEGGWSRM